MRENPKRTNSFDAESPDPIDSNEPLAALARDYARAGWTVTSRTRTAVTLTKETGKEAQSVRLYIDADDLLRVEGPVLPILSFDGRMRAWAMLGLVLIAVLAVAWAAGLFR